LLSSEIYHRSRGNSRSTKEYRKDENVLRAKTHCSDACCEGKCQGFLLVLTRQARRPARMGWRGEVEAHANAERASRRLQDNAARNRYAGARERCRSVGNPGNT